VTEDEFWTLIEDARRSSGGDIARQVLLLSEHFEATRSVEELLAFRDRWDEAERRLFAWPVWDAACVLLGFVSDDFFGDVRGWIISHGREVVQSVAADADSLVELAHDVSGANSDAVEDLGCLVDHLWEEFTGNEDVPESEGEWNLAGQQIDLRDIAVVRSVFPRLVAFREQSGSHLA